MNRLTLFSLVFLLQVFSLSLSGQESLEKGFERDEWISVKNRWVRAQPAIVLKSDNGTQIYGQPVHVSEDTLYLYPSTGFPVGPDWVNELEAIPLNTLNVVLMQ